MSQMTEHLAFIESQVSQPYIFGGEGQTATEKFIKDHASGADERNALRIRKRQIDKGIPQEQIKAWDCSGLPTEDLIKRGLIKGDMNANGLLKACRIISKSEVVPGCLTFRVSDSDGDGRNEQSDHAHHIGTCTAMQNGRPIITHAKGHAWGVVREDIDASGAGYWEVFGMPPWFEKEIMAEKKEDEDIMLKYGSKGALVGKWQAALVGRGYNIGTSGPDKNGVDDDFGIKTENGTKAFQTAMKLSPTGIVDSMTAAMMWSTPDVEVTRLRIDLGRANNEAAALKGVVKQFVDLAANVKI